MGIVAAKPANKGAQATAETVERRPMTNGNSQGQSTGRTQSRATVTQAAERIRQFVKRKPQEKLTALLHHVTPEALREAYYALKRPLPAPIRVASARNPDKDSTPEVPEGPILLGLDAGNQHRAVAPTPNRTPMAGPAICRQPPKVGAGWFNDHVRICAGGVG